MDDSKKYDFGLIGGDLRSYYLCMQLARAGFRICHCALCRSDGLSAGCISCPPGVLLAHSRAVIAPVPFSFDQKMLNQSKTYAPISLSRLLEGLQEDQLLFGGCFPSWFEKEANQKGILLYDFCHQEDFTLYNTIATAEGAIAEAICKSPYQLHKSHCLILGYGRCAQTLASLLKAMNCHVTVCARSSSARAKAALTVDETVSFPVPQKILHRSLFVFNTVPAPVCGADSLKQLPERACVLDLASAPGGVDLSFAHSIGLSACLLPGLPGRYAPASCASKMADQIFSILHCSTDKEVSPCP